LIAFYLLIDFRTRQSIISGLSHRDRGDLSGCAAQQGPRQGDYRRQPGNDAIGKDF
jgi:hypothetical protein